MESHARGGGRHVGPIDRHGDRASTGHSLRSLVDDVDWSVSYVAFLTFVFVILTYRFDIGDYVMGLGLAGLVLEKRKLRLPLPLTLFGLFIGWALIRYLFGSPFPEVTYERLIDFLQLWLIFFLAINVLNTKARVRFFVVFFLVLFVTHPLRGALFNKYLYGHAPFNRVVWRGIFGNPNDLAALSFLPLGIAAALLRDPNRWLRWGGAASIGLLSVLAFLTQSRGGILALLLFGILAILWERRRLRSLGLLALTCLAIVVTAPTGAFERMERIVTAAETGEVRPADEEGSAQQRLEILRVAAEVARENPFWGVGLGAYSRAHQIEAAANPEWAAASGQRDAHNTYMSVLAETGWPGLLLFLGLLAAVLRDARRTRRRFAGKGVEQIRYLEIALYAYLFAGLFGTYDHLTFLYLHLAVLTALCAMVRRSSGTVPGHAGAGSGAPSPSPSAG